MSKLYARIWLKMHGYCRHGYQPKFCEYCTQINHRNRMAMDQRAHQLQKAAYPSVFADFYAVIRQTVSQ